MAVTINASTTAGLVQTADTSGVLALQTAGTTAVSISASQVVTLANALPVASGGSGVTTSTGSGANVLGTSPSISGAVLSSMASSVITSGTAVASTSGTSIDFTSLPSWIKRITVMFNAISLSGASSVLVQLGTGATTYTTTGYVGGGARFGVSSVASGTFTTGFTFNNATAASLIAGSMTITNVTGNTWAASGIFGETSGEFMCMTGGSVPLAAVLTAVRITTVNGTDTFDAGSINILYE